MSRQQLAFAPPTTAGAPAGYVDLRDCKKRFAKLAANHPLRLAFQNENDFIPRHEAAAKFAVWLRLVYT